MEKVKRIAGWVLALYAIVVFCIEGGIEILPIQITAMLAFFGALTLWGIFKKERRNK